MGAIGRRLVDDIELKPQRFRAKDHRFIHVAADIGGVAKKVDQFQRSIGGYRAKRGETGLIQDPIMTGVHSGYPVAVALHVGGHRVAVPMRLG